MKAKFNIIMAHLGHHPSSPQSVRPSTVQWQLEIVSALPTIKYFPECSKFRVFLFGWLFFVWLGFLACLCLRWMDKNRISVDTWSFIATHYCHIEYIQYYMLYVGMLHPPEVNNCQFPARQKKNLSKRNRVKQHTQTSTLL